ncbi:probable RNA-directed DNA polymerase from transposon BS [Trichonephila clavipes]|nr:probable RNA-directed DNA polymerase from transposon BS [Trichonephila clavipes]
MTWHIENKVLHFYRTAYRAKHSTVDKLFYLVQSIINGLREKQLNKTIAVFLDLSAAFDRVWRQKLIDIIHHADITGNSLLWINDFLRDRKFVVRVNGNYSKTHRTWAGVPQGSVLCPLLFLLYMNTSHEYINDEANIACYADDIVIWNTNSDLSASEAIQNTNLTNVETWATNIKLLINPEKSTLCGFTTDRKNRKSFRPSIMILNSTINQISNTKYLGFTLNTELRSTKHFEATSLRALKKLNILRQLCNST